MIYVLKYACNNYNTHDKFACSNGMTEDDSSSSITMLHENMWVSDM